MYDFSRKIFPILYLINSLNFIVCLPLLLEILDNICIIIICCYYMYYNYLRFTSPFLWSNFSLLNQKVRTKMFVSLDWRELLIWNKKHFSPFLMGCHWSKWKLFLEHKNSTLKLCNTSTFSSKGKHLSIIGYYSILKLSWIVNLSKLSNS